MGLIETKTIMNKLSLFLCYVLLLDVIKMNEGEEKDGKESCFSSVFSFFSFFLPASHSRRGKCRFTACVPRTHYNYIVLVWVVPGFIRATKLREHILCVLECVFYSWVDAIG